MIELNYKKPDFVAELYQTLGTYQEKLGNVDAYQTSLQKVKAIYEQLYTPQDKRVIKTRRQISIVLLKNQKFKEALDELHQILVTASLTLGTGEEGIRRVECASSKDSEVTGQCVPQFE